MTGNTRIGRPPKCGGCGECKRCKRAAYMREWWNALTPQQKREAIARRDREKVRAAEGRRYERHKQVRLATSAAYVATETGREASQRARDRWSAANPEKRAAAVAVSNAIRDGRLQRGTCERAGDGCSGRIEAHHDDYTEPLGVRWLCKRHHVEADQARRATEGLAA